MKFSKLSLLSAIIFCSVSCQPKQTRINNLVSQFADLECNAIRLRESRFNLANKIRFAEDTLMQAPGNTDSLRLRITLQVLNNEKRSLLDMSRHTADSIRMRLDFLMNNELKTDDDKKNFNQLLRDTLKKRGCL